MKYKKPENLYKPSVNRPDKVEVPDETILMLTDHAIYNEVADELVESLNGNKKRDWFSQHFYFCLPLSMGNQYGFIVRSISDIIARWDGGENTSSLSVITSPRLTGNDRQMVSSHFGSGIITIQNRWAYRTPKNINLYVTQPPNFPYHGLHFMSAVIETDNLRRDFTFNIKVTQPDMDVFIPKGSPIGCFLPYPRRFIDRFQVRRHEENEILEAERKTAAEFGKIRVSAKSSPDMLYMRGLDAYENKFPDHQKGLERCPYLRNMKS